MTIRLLPALLSLLLVSACGNEAPRGSVADPTLAAPPVVQPVAQGPAIAEGPGVRVTLEDLRNEWSLMPPEQLLTIAQDDAQLRNLVNRIYFRRRMALLAEELGYEQDPLVQAQLRRGRELVFMELVPRRHLDALVMPDLSPAAREYYENNLEDFVEAPETRASHILLRAPSEAERASRRSEAEALLKRLEAGESFADLATEHGEDGTRRLGGDLGYFKPGAMVPEFEEAVVRLQTPGDFTLVETRFGLHLVQLTDRIEGGPIPFDTVEAAIAERLALEYQHEALSEWLRQVASPREAVVDEAATEQAWNELQALAEALLPPEVSESVLPGAIPVPALR
jgi:peptidyl-prolyl cis-trans isomerase C